MVNFYACEFSNAELPCFFNLLVATRASRVTRAAVSALGGIVTFVYHIYGYTGYHLHDYITSISIFIGLITAIVKIKCAWSRNALLKACQELIRQVGVLVAVGACAGGANNPVGRKGN